MRERRRCMVILNLVLALFLIGCHGHIDKVKDKWGPPAKVEDRGDTIVYYYYFYKGKATGVAVSHVATATATGGWVVVEITADRNGKILKKRKYWKQPKVE